MIAISTYSGECDGLGVAAELAGIEVAAYCEADPKRRAKLAEKHPGKPIFTTDEELTADAVHALGIHPDLLFGGPPCQPFSCAGSKRGVADPRHRWPEMLRCIRELRPRWVVVENVGNFVNLALDLVWTDLEEEGYETGAVVLPALAVGAPHCRHRCFVVAHAGYGQGREDLAPCGRVAGANAVQQRTESSGELERGSAGVADRESVGRGTWRAEPAGHKRQPGASERGAQGMGNAESAKRTRERPEQDRAQGGFANANWRSIESRLGGVLDGVSNRLDEVMGAWPAWRGQEQHPWEPPRTVRGMKDRARRIESLGLAVVPWQAYPIFALIKALFEKEDTP